MSLCFLLRDIPIYRSFKGHPKLDDLVDGREDELDLENQLLLRIIGFDAFDWALLSRWEYQELIQPGG